MLIAKLVVAVLVFISIPVDAELAMDQPAPLFSGVTSDGTTIDLADLRGKTVVLEWTDAGCPFVKKHYQSGSIPRLQKSAAARDIVWLQIISSADAGTQKLNAEWGATPAHIVLDTDGKIGKLYGVQITPHIFIANPDGVLVYNGSIDSIASANQEDIAKAENYISAALADLAEGKKVAISNTKPYGCTGNTPARS